MPIIRPGDYLPVSEVLKHNEVNRLSAGWQEVRVKDQDIGSLFFLDFQQRISNSWTLLVIIVQIIWLDFVLFDLVPKVLVPQTQDLCRLNLNTATLFQGSGN